MKVPLLVMSASNMAFLQRVFRLLCIKRSAAIFKNSQLSNPCAKDDLDVFLTKEFTEAYCLRLERKVFHLVVMFLRHFGLAE